MCHTSVSKEVPTTTLYAKPQTVKDAEEHQDADTAPCLGVYLSEWVRDGIPEPSNYEELLQLWALWMFIVGCLVWWAVDPHGAMWYANPWGLDFWAWLGWFEIKQWALRTVEKTSRRLIIRQGFPILGFRETETGRALRKQMERLQTYDYFYLRVNAIPDMVYLSHLTYYIFTSPGVVGLNQCTFMNTIVSWAVLVVVLDSTYALMHYLMHFNKTVYVAIHRHHHRFQVPERNFVDVRNYHPLELILSSAVNFPSFFISEWLVGASHISCLMAFLTILFVNISNHSEFEITIPYIFHSGNHETHHRHPRSNMGLCTFYADRLLGTYKPYVTNE